MRKGFTLIELLAVIVILAIIALIATPIILNIIEDTKKESNKRSKELYLDAVNQAIARKNLNAELSPTSCEVQSDGNLLCGETNVKVETDGERPCKGEIIFKKGKIDSETIQFCEDNSETTQKSICKLISKSGGSEYNYGDEYTCDPGDGEIRTFYLLEDGDTSGLTKVTEETLGSDETVKLGTAGAGEVSLIMERNIDNSAIWITQEDYENAGGTSSMPDNSKGPLTALAKLKNLTFGWNRVQVYLPTYNQIISAEIDDAGSLPLWLYNYTFDPENLGTMGPDECYMTYSASSFNSNYIWYVHYRGYISSVGDIAYGSNSIYYSYYGIRPVITISKSQLDQG